MFKKGRALTFLFVFTILFFSLIARLAQVQLVSTENFSKNKINLLKASVRQRTEEFYLEDGRGKIVDQNNKQLDHIMKPVVLIFPEFILQTKKIQKEFADLVGIPYSEILDQWNRSNGPFFMNVPDTTTSEEIAKLKSTKYVGTMLLFRQSDQVTTFAQHALGLVKYGEDKTTLTGITGVQAAFNEFLKSDEESKLLYHVDKMGNPLFGSKVKVTGNSNPHYPLTIQTTIDENLQRIAEKAVDDQGLQEGGLILIDIKTNSIRAMVSRPTFNPKNPYGDKVGIRNKLLDRTIPGSIFKILTLATAYETGIDKQQGLFNCDLDVYGSTINKRKLGMLTLTRSLALSCNYTFATLAEELLKKDPNYFEEAASALGLSPKVGWNGTVYHDSNFEQMPEEEETQIWVNKKEGLAVPKAIRQTAIGQANVRVTPLGVANMMATIARGGEARQVRIVDEIYYKTGAPFFTFDNDKLNDTPFSKATMMKVQNDLRQVVVDPQGTGRIFQGSPYEIAGKSGTGEVVDVKSDGEVIPLNKWFAGYFPFNNPQYAMVVVQLNTYDQKISKANAVFFDFVNELKKYEEELKK